MKAGTPSAGLRSLRQARSACSTLATSGPEAAGTGPLRGPAPARVVDAGDRRARRHGGMGLGFGQLVGRGVAVELGQERGRAGGVGQHRHPADAAGDGDMEHAALLLDGGAPWASRWGITPSLAPNSATRGHSRPLTRWMVDSVTPASSGGRARAARSHG